MTDTLTANHKRQHQHVLVRETEVGADFSLQHG